MKKIFLLFAIVSLMWACNNEAEVESTTSTTTDSSNADYPYKASYSSDFGMGNQEYSKTVLNLYKYWDANNLDAARDLMADTVTVFTADGSRLHGTGDSILSMIKTERGKMGNVNTDVEVWIPLKSNDKNENWVAVWAIEHRTDSMQKQDSTALQETWRVNQNGKIDLMLQYARNGSPPPPSQMPSSANKPQ